MSLEQHSTPKYQELPYGFKFGPVAVERWCSDDKKGWVLLGVKSEKQTLQLYVTKTGKIRVFTSGEGGKEWFANTGN